MKRNHDDSSCCNDTKKAKSSQEEDTQMIAELKERLRAVLEEQKQVSGELKQFNKETNQEIEIKIGGIVLKMIPSTNPDKYLFSTESVGILLKFNLCKTKEKMPMEDFISFEDAVLAGVDFSIDGEKVESVKVGECDCLNMEGDGKNGYGSVVLQLYSFDELHLQLERFNEGIQLFRLLSAGYKTC
jgi:hypothetical protein